MSVHIKNQPNRSSRLAGYMHHVCIIKIYCQMSSIYPRDTQYNKVQLKIVSKSEPIATILIVFH